MVSGLRGSISFLLSDIKVHGSQPDLGRTASTESQDFPSSPDVTQISLARTLSTGNKWNTTKFSIWTAFLSPLNRPALFSTSAWLRSDANWVLSVFTQQSLAESGMMLRRQDYWITTHCSCVTIHTVHAFTYSAARWLFASGPAQLSMWEPRPSSGCIQEWTDVTGDGVTT